MPGINDFPLNPTNGQIYTNNDGFSWKWNGNSVIRAWEKIVLNVKTLNGLSGGVTLAAGTGITFTSNNNVIILSTLAGIGATGPTGPTEDSLSIIIEATPDDISTGNKGFRFIPYNCTPLEWYVIAGQTGSIEFDVKVSSFANYPTTNSIVGGNFPGLSGAMKNSNTGITLWGGLTAGDVVDFVINSNTGIQKVGLFIKIRRNT